MSEVYRSPYEAYPFLSDAPDDLRCDFEILTDELASGTGLLRAHFLAFTQQHTCAESALCDELNWICEIIYHINPTLRTRLTVTSDECKHLHAAVDRLTEQTKDRCNKFVLPTGGALACEAHVLRVKAKKLVRLIYRHIASGHEVPDLLLDVANLLSGYFFLLALHLNDLEGVEEIPFVSRNYL